MGLWSREALLLVLVAVFASLSGSANSLDLDRLTGQAVSADKATVSSSPTGMNATCQCDHLPAVACSCGIAVNGNLFGNRVAIDPRINVEFIDRNMSIVISLSNQNKTLISREISGREMIPPVCVPLPQFPAVVFCLEFHNLTCSIQNKTVSVCTVFGINAVLPVSLPVHPSLPIGCFTAGPTVGLKYSPPEYNIPQVDKLAENIQMPSGNFQASINQS